MTVKDAAIKLGVNPKTIRRWIQSGKLKAEKNTSGNITEWMITEEEIQKHIPSHEVIPAAKPQIQAYSSQEQFLALLESTLAALKDQLDRKDMQIIQLQKQIEQLMENSKKAFPMRKPPLWKALLSRKAYLN